MSKNQTPSTQGHTAGPFTVVHSHRMNNVESVVTADGEASLLGVVYGSPPNGTRIIGNGTIPHPLNVDATDLLAERDRLAALNRHLVEALELTLQVARHTSTCAAMERIPGVQNPCNCMADEARATGRAALAAGGGR